MLHLIIVISNMYLYYIASTYITQNLIEYFCKYNKTIKIDLFIGTYKKLIF